MDTPALADEVLAFWLGPLDEHGRADEAHRKRWFMKDAEFDQEIERRFGALHAEIARGEHEDWLRTRRGRLATVIVLDQFSRNLHRDTPAMVAQDERALGIARQALDDEGDGDESGAHERYFLFMPFMHAEDLDAQNRCVALFEEAQAAMPDELASTFDPKWAVMHRDIIARFGRFPHRNAMLGRQSTPEETAFLQEPGSSF